MRGIAVLPVAVSLLIAVGGCDGVESGAAPFSAVDSAGVTIVESLLPLWGRGEGWSISQEPELSVGLSEGDERYLLSEVRGVRRLSDGRVAILDGGSYRVRIYDSTGTHLMDLGGEGDGPSEFRTPQFLGIVSDTLFVYEAIGGAVTWFSPSGQFLRRSAQFNQADRAIGTLLMFGHFGNRFGVGMRTGGASYRPREAGINREPWSVWRFGLDDSGVDSLVSVPGGEVEIISSDSRGTHQRRYVFGKWTALSASKARIYAAPTDEFSIQELDEDGHLRRIIRRRGNPRSVSQSDLSEWVDQSLIASDRPREERAEMRRSASELRFAETMPAFRGIAVDSEDNLWVEEWEGVGVKQGSFSVFRSDGAWLGRVDLPRGLAVAPGELAVQTLEIGSDYVLGVWEDEYGVEQVRLYRIEKS